MNEYLITFLYELANFAAFAVLFAWIFMKPIRQLLEKQAASDKELSESAKQRLAEAGQLRQDVMSERDNFNDEMERQRKSMLQESQQQAAAMLATAKKQMNDQREQLHAETLHYQEAQVTALAETIADVSRQSVSKLLQQIDGPALEDAIIESVCRQLKQNEHPFGHVSVDSASEIGELSRQKLAAALGVDMPNETIEYRVVADLIGGLRVTTKRGMIDNSIAALSKFAGQSFRQQITHTNSESIS